MAEDKQTTGTVLERLGGMGTFYNPDHQAIANAVRSNMLSRQDVNTLTSFQLNTLGSNRYQALYPEVFEGSAQAPRAMSAEAMEAAALRELRASLTGVGNSIYRQMIDQRLQVLGAWAGRTTVGARSEISNMLPEWIKPFISEGNAYQRPETGLVSQRGGLRGQGYTREPTAPIGAGKLRPLSAQAELSLEQQEFLASYLAWAKSGFPSGYGQGSAGSHRLAGKIMEMAGKQGSWWQEYQRQSQSLFPTANLQTTRQRIFEQR